MVLEATNDANRFPCISGNLARTESEPSRGGSQNITDLEGFIKVVVESLVGRLWGSPQLRVGYSTSRGSGEDG
jgi:hypothetical protein